ncbi:Peptidase M22; Glycoprotease [Candidatus Blochmanniella floridana]|uniref:tRNA threonylcarbamoyladenosine biosynthesis protein TsaB n=1 Tax=Blochmanniella floridana TaxID=203907 RepID=Q7VQY8_BLOFL|nr:Peptidase M22; Glycoprotease [Candidatus Blochmannia floridanus]
MRVLAFNTVTELCSVALMIDQNIYNSNIFAPRCHAEKILPMINKLLVDVGIALKSIDCIVFDRGPGSFIGVRIGISVAQGLSIGSDLPLISVSSLQILAQKAWRVFSARHVISTAAAYMDKLYWGCYSRDLSNNFWVCKNAPCLVTGIVVKKTVEKLKGQWMCVGTGWSNNQQLKYCVNKNVFIRCKEIMLPEAQDMLPLGVHSWNDKKILNPDQVDPIY